MTVRTLITALAALLMAVGLLAPVAADGETDPPTEAYPTEWLSVGTQHAGTFGGAPEEAELGTLLGADLREGLIRMPDEDTVELKIQLEFLPPNGGTPEVIRYTWDMTIDGATAQVDGKWMNYSRGACDPTSGQCNPAEGDMPRDPGMQPFLFRANQNESCLGADVDGCVGVNFSAYDDLAVIQAEFDPDEATITVLVPVEVISQIDDVDFGACSTIAPRGGLFGGVIETMPAAFISSNAFPSDVIPMFPNRVFEVPPPAEFDTCADYLASLDPGE